MALLIDLLDKYIFSGVPSNAAWDLIRSIWEKVNERSWEDLYLDAFEAALRDARPRLKKYSDDEVSLDRQVLRRTLHQDLAVSVSAMPLSALADERFAGALARALAERQALIIGGHSLTQDDYAQLVRNLVRQATALFKSSVRRNQIAFQHAMIEEALTNRALVREIQRYLANRFDLTLAELAAIQREQQVHTALLQAIAGYSSVCISSAGNELKEYEVALATMLGGLGYKVVSLRQIAESSPSPLKEIKKAINACDVFIGLYASRYGSLVESSPFGEVSWTELEFEYARMYFRRCICFVASEHLHAVQLPRPQKQPYPPKPAYPSQLSALRLPPPPYYAPKGVWLLLKMLKALWYGRELPRARERREQEQYNRTLEIHAKMREKYSLIYKEALEAWQARVQKIDQEYESALAVYTFQIERQKAFLDKVRSHFLVYEFRSRAELEREVTTTIEHLEAGRIVGFSRIDIASRWDKWARHQEDTLRKEDLYHRPPLPSPLERAWDDFCQQSWLDKMRTLVADVQKAARVLSNRPEVNQWTEPLERLPGNLFTRDWEDIVEYLLAWCREETVRQVEERLRELLKEKEEDEGKEVKGEKEQTSGSLVERLKTEIDEWQATTQRLLDELSTPRFGRCFLVLGRAGAGKTHFVAGLLRSQTKRTGSGNVFKCLYLGKARRIEPAEGEPWDEAWEQFLLEQARFEMVSEPGYPEWRSLTELNDFFYGVNGESLPATRLAIVLDDLAEWIKLDPSFLHNLARFAKSHTHVLSIVWLFTLSEADYSYVANHEDFCRTYGYQPSTAPVSLSGWLSLDALNEGEPGDDAEAADAEGLERYRVLKRILAHHLKDESSVKEVIHLLNPASLKLLSIPFVGWTAAELIRRDKRQMLRELPNLRFIDFVEKFWEQRFQELIDSRKLSQRDGQTLRKELDKVIEFITKALTDQGTNEFYVPQLAKNLKERYEDTTWLGNLEIAVRLIMLLTGKDFLRRMLDADEEHKITLGFTPFWEYQGGKWLAERLPQHQGVLVEAEQEINSRFGESGTARSYVGIFEFLLLVLDRKVRSSQVREREDLAQYITRFALQKLPNLRPCVWVAASKAGETYQYRLASWLVEQERFPLRDREEISYYLYFLKHAWEPQLDRSETGVSWSVRLKLVQPYYQEIAHWHLEGYFARYILDKVISHERDGRELAKALAYLHGIEDYITPDTLARELPHLPTIERKHPLISGWSQLGKWAFQALQRRASLFDDPWPQLTEWILAMVSEVAKVIPDESVKSKEGTAERDKLWGCVLEHFCEQLVEEKKLGSFYFLKKHGWFIWSNRFELPKKVLRSMEDRLTTTLGRWYRRTPGARKEYHQLVKGLVNYGSGARKITAIYLIYHTIPSDSPGRPITRNLWYLLDKLRHDQSHAVQSAWRASETLRNFYERQKDIHAQVT